MPRSLPLVLVAYFIFAVWRQDPDSFGYFHDDTMYFSSARALARGEGYVNPSVPGTPAQTKYPVLYPLLLAGVWKLNPQFPDNLSLALGLTAFFGALLLAGWFFLLRDLKAGVFESFIVAGIAAFHPLTLWLAGALLSDIPFMAFAAAAAVLARLDRTRTWAAAGACAAAAALTRSIGIAVIAGIFTWALYRRSYRWAFAFLAVAAPPVIAGLAWSAAHQSVSAGLPGFQQTMTFYTSYAAFWKLSVPDLGAFGQMLKINGLEIVQSPAALVLPIPTFPGRFGVMILLSLAILVGLYKLEWRPIHFILGFYTLVVLFWNYPLANRFLLFFIPVFLFGGVRAIAAIPSLAKRVRVQGRYFIALPVAGVYIYAWGLATDFSAAAEARRSLAQEKAEAYEWIRARTADSERFIAYEDVSLYLHTGRQGLRPLAFSSEAQYRNAAAVVERDLQKLTDTARQIRGQYWLSSADDYQLEAGAELIQQRADALLRHFPVVFQSTGRRVRIYRVAAE